MSKTPIVRPISLGNTLITLALLGVYVFIGAFLGGVEGALLGTLFFLICSQVSRRIFTREHRRAIQYCRNQEYARAIPLFEQSIEFFERNRWVDQYRAIVLFSSSSMSYREMGLVSVAFCYAQMGDGDNSRLTYEKCLNEFPDNMIAKTSLNFLVAGAAVSESSSD